MHTKVNLILFALFLCGALAKKENRLNGKHLWIVPLSIGPQLRVNDSVQLKKNMPRPVWVQMDIVDWIAQRRNFTYSILATNETTMEPVGKGKRGAISLLNEGTLDLAVGEVFMLPSRFPYLDMPYPWHQTKAALLIPISDARANVAAVLKPFDSKGWICIAASVLLVSVSVMIFNHWFPQHQNRFVSRNHQLHRSRIIKPFSHLYTVEVLLGQGGTLSSRMPSTLVMAGVWCLAAFVLSQAYMSTLFTYVISPNQRPLVNSINDVVASPNIRLLVEKNVAFDVMFSTATDQTGIFKQIRDRINKFPESRCEFEPTCIELVRSGGPYTYLKSVTYILDIMQKDYLKTGECRLQPAKEGFMNLCITFGLAKRSPYSDHFREGFIELNAFGLPDHWIKKNRANPRRCLDMAVQKRSANPRLSLMNLTGAFVILISGLSASVLLFCLECLASFVAPRVTSFYSNYS